MCAALFLHTLHMLHYVRNACAHIVQHVQCVRSLVSFTLHMLHIVGSVCCAYTMQALINVIDITQSKENNYCDHYHSLRMSRLDFLFFLKVRAEIWRAARYRKVHIYSVFNPGSFNPYINSGHLAHSVHFEHLAHSVQRVRPGHPLPRLIIPKIEGGTLFSPKLHFQFLNSGETR